MRRLLSFMFLLCRLTRAACTCAPSFTVLRNRRLYEAFLTDDVEGKQPRPTPPLSKTPPYVTAKPEVTALPIAGADAAEGELRFVVLATDGRASLNRRLVTFLAPPPSSLTSPPVLPTP